MPTLNDAEGNLSWTLTWQALKDHMRQAGEVVHAQIITEFNTGRSKGCGIVEYATDEEAQKAITTLTDSAVPLSNPVVVE
jgi:RNA recognition motif-containing protein